MTERKGQEGEKRKGLVTFDEIPNLREREGPETGSTD